MVDSDNPHCLAMLGMPYDDQPSIKECTRFLTKYCPKWYEIGLKLGLKATLLDVIKLDHYMKYRECFMVTLQNWLKQNPHADWKGLELAITNTMREAGDLEPLTMEEMLRKLEAAHNPVQEGDKSTVPVQEEVTKVEPVQEHRNGAYKQVDGGQEQRSGAAVIEPETAPTSNRGKGMVKDVVFAETKKAICRINSPIMTGTGFLGYAKCGEGRYCTVLVTNNHVITSFEDAMGSLLVFENVYVDHKINLKGSDIFVKDSYWCSPMSQLDYSMLEINESKLVDPATNKPLDINPFQMTRPTDINKEGDQIYVIQHPRGERLAFSSSDSVVRKPLLLYQCTTDLGSSGSPVLKEVDGELKVVALHRGGRETGNNWVGYNCGTLIQEILNHLQGKPATPLPNNSSVQDALKKISK